MFLYRTITSKINKNIDNKLAPFEQSTKDIHNKLDSIKNDTIREIKTKEEIDRERFRNLHDGQEFMKEQLKEGVQKTIDANVKLDKHLLESAEFVGRTENRLDNIERRRKIDSI